MGDWEIIDEKTFKISDICDNKLTIKLDDEKGG